MSTINELSLAAAVLLLAAPALAADVPIPAKVHLVKQDKAAGFVGKQAKIVSKPLAGTFPLPSADPTAVGATLRFFPVRPASSASASTR